jgi:calmodulin
MSKQLSNQQFSELKSVFSLFDIDDDGKISIKELKTIMKALGQNISEEELRTMLNLGDVDGSGTIEFQEFVDIVTNKMTAKDSEDELLEAFRVFDKDGSGSITKAELKYAMLSLGERLGEREIDKMLNAADSNHDGQIDYQGEGYSWFLPQKNQTLSNFSTRLK